ncbi:DUF488 domain-containing protein [Symbiopectobacterium purcellii]|uniref:DUF488 domain-containing protein n=1 Tax=Symbiopectobacterium purcellii TaxID=2871826 RepID=UPI003F85443F
MSTAIDVPRIHLQRVYDVHSPFAHPAFLVDRLWQRGVRKARPEGAQWLKEVAPSTALRQAFHAAPDAWDTFVTQYCAELAQQRHWQVITSVLACSGEVTLLYASKEPQRNHAQVLRDFLLAQCSA